jgi:hypothetical protein
MKRGGGVVRMDPRLLNLNRRARAMCLVAVPVGFYIELPLVWVLGVLGFLLCSYRLRGAGRPEKKVVPEGVAPFSRPL